MKLLNVGHLNKLGTTNTDYKFKIVTLTLLTDRFLLKTYFWKYNLLQAIAHTEINVRANVSDFGTMDKGKGIARECAGSKGKFGFIHANSEGSGKSAHLSLA